MWNPIAVAPERMDGLTVAQVALADALIPGLELNEIEAGVYSTSGDASRDSDYDTRFGSAYEWVACNPLYNRLIWGYSIKKYSNLVEEAVAPNFEGPVLDLGCGSLAFTARAYIRLTSRTILCSDQSIKMIRLAKARLTRMSGQLPENIAFLLADATRLPFRAGSLGAVVCLNLLHCLPDVSPLLRDLHGLVREGSGLYFTTLVRADRLADKYLGALAQAGKLTSRSLSDISRAFTEAGFQATEELRGSLAFIRASANKAL